ncbi:MAG: cellulase family glycosylhydrolase [bacterium]
MKKIVSSLLLLLIIMTDLYSQGFLHVSGNKIVNGSGSEILLRGIGLGGWLVQEGYMLKTPMDSEHEIRKEIVELMGEAKTAEFYAAYHENYVRKIDIDNLASWGFNSIRLPMHYNKLTPLDQTGVYLEEGFKQIDDLLDWCEANQIYLILDLHAAPGGQNNGGISDYDPTKPSLWESEANKQKTVDLWTELAKRYKDEQWIGGYDVINEPAWNLGTNNPPLRDLYIRITNAIRAHDNNHIIFVEGNWYATDFSGLTPAWDANMVYSFHKYWNPNTQSAIQGYLNLRTTTGLPIWCGEFGENSDSWIYDCIKLFEDNNIGWAIWPHKKIDNITGPLSVPLLPQYQQLLNYWNGSGSKPTESFTYAALMAQADKLKFEECRYQPDFIDAMFRQQIDESTIPFKDHSIPGRIYAVDFNLGRLNSAYFDTDNGNSDGNSGWNSGYKYRNEGVDIEACSDSYTNGYNVGWINSAEYLKYTVNVSATGNYDLNIRAAAANSGGKILFMLDDANLTDFIDVAVTGGWQTWRTVTVKDVYIEEGQHTITARFFFGGFNFNYIEFMPGTVGVEEEENILLQFELSQNYPNPFNPTTTIKYSIPDVETPYMASLQHVTLKIFDTLGREVAVLFDEEQAPGLHEITFDASNLPSGIYLYKIQAGDLTSSKKMILLK